MKKCLNPNCNPAIFYNDEYEYCPLCNNKLYKKEHEKEVLQPDLRHNEDSHMKVEFVQYSLTGIKCFGRIIEIDHQELFMGTYLKLANALFRGEPYQFSHQTIQYTLRIENLEEPFSTETMDFCLYGNYLGRFHVGDIVSIHAHNKGDRNVVTSIRNETTKTYVKPGILVPAFWIRSGLVIATFFVSAVIYEFLCLYNSGVLNTLVEEMIALIIIVCILWAWK